MIAPDEVQSWFKQGRGHGFEVVAADDDVFQWLNNLPRELAPYTVVGKCNNTTNCDANINLFEIDATLFTPEVIKAKKPFYYYLRSKMITPDRLPDTITPIGFNQFCSYNGFIYIVHGTSTKKQLDATWLSMIQRVVHMRFGETRQHAEYFQLFTALKKQVMQTVRYTSEKTFPDGTILEIPEIGVTEAAAEEYRNGMPFRFRPCKPIAKAKATMRRKK